MRRALIALILCSLLPLGALAATVTLTASPTSGISPLAVTLTWSASADLTSCTASGAWSGTKATSGSQVVSDLRASATFSLTCVGPVGDVTVNWTPPTQNTDGSTIAAVPPGALAGFELFHATTAAAVAGSTPVVINDKTATSYVFSGLPVGPHYWAAKAFNTEGIRSALTNTVNATLVQPSASANAAVTVNVKPMPPVMGAVAQQAYEVNFNAFGTKLTKLMGTVELGTPCGSELLLTTQDGGWYAVDAQHIEFTKNWKADSTFAARCEPVT